MKEVYKEKVLSHFDGIDMRIGKLEDMLQGRYPSNHEDRIRLIREIHQLLELSKNLVEVS
jgi:hypothetical protein